MLFQKFCENLNNWDANDSYHNCPKYRTVWLLIVEVHHKDADGMANSVDPGQADPEGTIFWVCTDCSRPICDNDFA